MLRFRNKNNVDFSAAFGRNRNNPDAKFYIEIEYQYIDDESNNHTFRANVFAAFTKEEAEAEQAEAFGELHREHPNVRPFGVTANGVTYYCHQDGNHTWNINILDMDNHLIHTDGNGNWLDTPVKPA